MKTIYNYEFEKNKSLFEKVRDEIMSYGYKCTIKCTKYSKTFEVRPYDFSSGEFGVTVIKSQNYITLLQYDSETTIFHSITNVNDIEKYLRKWVN